MRLCVLRPIVIAGIALAALLSAPRAWSEEFVMIRNARNPSTFITAVQAREMVIGKRKVWPRGAVVQMVLTPVGTPELTWFATMVCEVKVTALMSKIKQEVFKGEVRKPVIAASEQEVVNAVATDEGAIGIVRADVARGLPATVAVLALALK